MRPRDEFPIVGLLAEIATAQFQIRLFVEFETNLWKNGKPKALLRLKPLMSNKGRSASTTDLKKKAPPKSQRAPKIGRASVYGAL
jgi:hypothetical protein